MISSSRHLVEQANHERMLRQAQGQSHRSYFTSPGGSRLKEGPTRDQFLQNIPIQRMGKRVEIGDVCLYTVTRGGELLTGTTIIADGGSWLTGSNSMNRVSSLKSLL